MKPHEDVLHRRDYTVRTIEADAGRHFIAQHHYARSAANTATYCHGLFRRDDPQRLLGVAWWIPPTRSAAVANWGGDPNDVLNLSRLAIAPNVPTNAATFLTSQSLRLIARDGRYRCILSYADTYQGHTGRIYRALGWEYLGLTTPESTWLDRDGRLVARKAGPKTRTKADMEALGHRMVGRFAKHRFRHVITTRTSGVRQGRFALEVA